MTALCPCCLSGELRLNAGIGASAQVQLSHECFGWPHIHQMSASPKQTRREPRQMMLHPGEVTTCAVLSTNALQLPEH